jgi:hypothetical protein
MLVLPLQQAIAPQQRCHLTIVGMLANCLLSIYTALTLGDTPTALGVDMGRAWEADVSASLSRRLGKSATELGATGGRDGCPDIWQLDNGDIAVIGRDLTAVYRGRLPESVTIATDQRLVIIPGNMLIAAKADIPDA